MGGYRKVSNIVLDKPKYRKVENITLDNPIEPPVDTSLEGEAEGSSPIVPSMEESHTQQPNMEQAHKTQIFETSPEDPDMEWKDVFTQSIKSIPGSTGKFIMDTLSIIAHPQQTKNALTGLAQGALQKLTPDVQKSEENVDLMVDFMKDRYGSVEKFKKTLAKDPTGVLSDVATFAVPGGAALKGVGTATKVKTLTNLGNKAIKTGTMIDPFNLGMQAVTRTVLPKALPASMYRRAVKFTSNDPDVISRLTQTGIDEAIYASNSGLSKLKSRINVLGKEIDDKINVQTKLGKRIKIKDIIDYAKESKKIKILDDADRKIYTKAIDDFIKEQAVYKRRLTLSPDEAQRLKKDFNERLATTYNSITAQPISAQTQKALNAGLKKNLELLVPEIKHMNAKEGALLELREAMTTKVGSMSKADMAHFSELYKVRAAKTIAGGPGMLSAITAGILSGPSIQTKLAVLLDRTRKLGIQVAVSPEITALRNSLITSEKSHKGRDTNE